MVGQIDGMKREKQIIGEWKESQEREIRRFLINHHRGNNNSLDSNGKRKTQNLQQEQEEESKS